MNWYRRLERMMAERYLSRIRSEHLARYPQMAVYSFDYIGNCIALDGRYENGYLTVLERELLNGLEKTVALDVGANIGNHSLALAPFFDKVLAFEPNRSAFQLLAVNSSLRSNVHPLNVGLSDATEEASLYYSSTNLGGASRVSRSTTLERSFRARFTTIDDLKEIEKERIGFIKIDVEGEELRVLAGGLRTITRDHPFIVCEVLGSAGGGKGSELIAFLDKLGYRSFYEVIPDHKASGRLGRLRRLTRFESRFYQMIVAASASIGRDEG